MCQECGEDLIPMVINTATGGMTTYCQNCKRTVKLTKEESNGIYYR